MIGSSGSGTQADPVVKTQRRKLTPEDYISDTDTEGEPLHQDLSIPANVRSLYERLEGVEQATRSNTTATRENRGREMVQA